MKLTLSSGQFKQEVLKGYNQINKKIFNSGVKEQKVDILHNKVLIFSINPRSSVLKILDDMDQVLSRQIDALLIDRFKEEFQAYLESNFQFHVVAILKDYDAKTGNSGTVVLLDRDVDTYLND